MSRMLDALRQIDGRSLLAGEPDAPPAPEEDLPSNTTGPEVAAPLATFASDPSESRATEQQPAVPEPPTHVPAANEDRDLSPAPPTESVESEDAEPDLDLPPIQPIRVRSTVPDGNLLSPALIVERPGGTGGLPTRALGDDPQVAPVPQSLQDATESIHEVSRAFQPDDHGAGIRRRNPSHSTTSFVGPLDDCPIAVSRLLRTFPPGRPGVLLFASPEPDGAATSVVAALAAELAPRVTGEILAVDGNFRGPALTERLLAASDAADSPGLIDVLNGGIGWGAAVGLTEIGHLDLLAGRAPRSGESAAVDPRRWEVLLEELRRAYQLVLVDASPAGDSAVKTVARYADGVYLVIDLGRTGRRAAIQAAATLRQAGGRVLGCVVAEPG